MIQRSLCLLAALAAFTGLTGFDTPDRYVAGQVWEYHTRPGDEGSLLKIKRIEAFGPPERGDRVYHISVIRFRLGSGGTVLQHSPVSRETLDASVTRLGNQTVEFPDPADGILDWKAHNGGVFTITVAEIIELIERQTSGR